MVYNYEFYVIYWLHNKNEKATWTLWGSNFESIRDVNNVLRKVVKDLKSSCEAFMIYKYYINYEFLADHKPDKFINLMESRYVECHSDGNINVYHKRRYLYV